MQVSGVMGRDGCLIETHETHNGITSKLQFVQPFWKGCAFSFSEYSSPRAWEARLYFAHFIAHDQHTSEHRSAP
jgi:hypothetical protein